VWRSGIARVILLRHQNHPINRRIPLHPSLKIRQLGE
jgi:hypothetical protein